MHNIYYVSYNSKNENIINIKHVLKNNKVPVRLASWLHTFYDIYYYILSVFYVRSTNMYIEM